MVKVSSRVIVNDAAGTKTSWRVTTVKLCGFTVYQSQEQLPDVPTTSHRSPGRVDASDRPVNGLQADSYREAARRETGVVGPVSAF